MKQIKLGKKDVYALVDDDFIAPEKGSFCLSTHGYPIHKYYSGQKSESGKSYLYVQTYLHHLVMGKPDYPLEVDHINGNRLDNRKENLRICTRQQNAHNISKKSGKYRGVHLSKKSEKYSTGKKWIAQITCDYKIYSLGAFKTEEEAARAYNEKAIELYGNFARLNQIEV